VAYIDIEAGKREGKSHISLLKDGVRFFLIIFKIGTLYSPLKIFMPIATTFFGTGVLYYLYTFIRYHTFTNLSPLLFMPAITCSVITAEKERNPFGLLLLTRLSPWTILLEKLLSRLVPMLSFLPPPPPLMGFAYAVGGLGP